MKKIKCSHAYYGYGYETHTNLAGRRSDTVYSFKCSRCGKIRRVKTVGRDYILAPEMRV